VQSATATVLLDGERIARVGLLAGRNVAEPTLPERIWGTVTGNLLLPLAALLVILGVVLLVRHQRARSMRSRMRRISRRTR
jgi:hypothetical protein